MTEASGQVLAETVFPTRADDGVEAWLARTAEAARRLVPAGAGIAAIGVGAAGQVDARGVLVATANVGGWGQINLGARLGEQLGCPGTTDNDAKVELLAELRAGVAKGFANVFLVAVGTGIGGALSVGGEIYRGGHGFAGEFGHAHVAGGDRLCGCGRVGHLETIASGSGIARAALLAGIDIGAEGARAVFARADAGDARCGSVLTEAGSVLGGAIAGVVTLMDPDVVVLAGGVADAGGGFWEAARQAFEAAVHPTVAQTPWRRAALGDRAGAIGACFVAQALR